MSLTQETKVGFDGINKIPFPQQQTKVKFDEKNMKSVLPVILIALWPLVALSSQAVRFKESNSFRLTTQSRAVMKGTNGDFIVLSLERSNLSDNPGGFTETASISWLLLTGEEIKSGKAEAFIRYESEEVQPGEFELQRIEGSDVLSIGPYEFTWSYGTSDSVFIYPPTGSKYAISVEP